MDEEPFDIDDYEPVQFNTFEKLLNVYLTYYKRLHSSKENMNLFDGINLQDNISTNKPTEELFNLMQKFKNADEIDKDVLHGIDSNLQIDQCQELYMLYINNQPKYLSKYLYVILNYITELNDDIHWMIMPLKTSE